MSEKTPPAATLREKIVADLTAHIKSNALPLGTRLPSLTALAEKYGVSRITAIAAVKELVNAGLLVSRPRSGIFVASVGLSPPQSDRNVIAIIVTAVLNPFYASIIHGAEEQCHQRGYRLVIASSNNEAKREADKISELIDHVAGFLIAPVTGAGNYSAYTPLLERDIPFVFVDRYLDKLSVPVVTTDNEEGGYEATRHLLETGRKRIFVLTGSTATSTTERIAGYRRALKARKIIFDPALVCCYPHKDLVDEKVGYLLTRQILQSGAAEEPFGIFALNSGFASGAYVALKDAGLRIPEDVAIVGFDDLYAEHMAPLLTTVRTDLMEIGSKAVELLFALMEGTPNVPQAVRLPPTLIVRNSSVVGSGFSLARAYSRQADIPHPLLELTS